MSDKLEPSPEAMQAARTWVVDTFGHSPLTTIGETSLAHALDAFAEAARKDEREAIITWICQNHFHEDDLIEMIRQRGDK